MNGGLIYPRTMKAHREEAQKGQDSFMPRFLVLGISGCRICGNLVLRERSSLARPSKSPDPFSPRGERHTPYDAFQCRILRGPSSSRARTVASPKRVAISRSPARRPETLSGPCMSVANAA